MPKGSSALRRHAEEQPARLAHPVAEEALRGLTKERKTLPPKLFYDDEGCRLFASITELPEYDVTRTELALLRERSAEIAAHVPPGATVVEYGAGSETKAAILLAALRAPAAYVPIDVADAAMQAAARRLSRRFPRLRIVPVAADFLAPLALPPSLAEGARLGFFPGSTIGNLEPVAAQAFLRQARAELGPGSLLLVGVDLPKELSILIPAYDDGEGVTAAFNRNVLARLNREAAADFDPENFAHLALWNAAESRIEMHLVSRRAQTVHVAGRSIHFAAGESIHTENSYKHSVDAFRSLSSEAGWASVQLWTDPDALFSVHLLSAGE